ncbi:MAG: flagellar biosynthetic protein FliQ [Deltaproteobacteria bacterium]|nr:flagellar biosynthetic protein FliQ [Deltaproteobacteria bacterium]
MPTASLLTDGLTTVMVLAGPLVGVLAAVGLVTGILQAATQVNDPALGFLPRVVALVATVWLTGGWMLERLAGMVAGNLAGLGGSGP